MCRPSTATASVAVVLAIVAGATACSAAISPIEVEAAQMAARVKTALVNDSSIGTRVIDVRVRHGVVLLSGNVASAEEEARALEVARRVPGVTRVDSQLQIGVQPQPALDANGDARLEPDRSAAYEFAELESEPSTLALGGALAFANQQGSAGARVAVSPLVRLGAGAGLGPTVAFEWFDATPLAPLDRSGDVGRLRVRPVMGGVRYTLQVGRLSIAPSLVGGYSFNSLRVAESGDVERLSVDVSNSFAWRPGIGFWIESSRHTTVHLSIGRVFTSPKFTIVEDGRLRGRTFSADTTVLLVGMAYKIF